MGLAGGEAGGQGSEYFMTVQQSSDHPPVDVGRNLGSTRPPLCLALTLSSQSLWWDTRRPGQRLPCQRPAGLGHGTGWGPSGEPGRLDVWPRHRCFVPGPAAAREPGGRVTRRGSGRRVNGEHDAQSPARGASPKGGRPLGGPANCAGGDIHGLTGGRTSDWVQGQGLGLETPPRPPLGPSPEVRPSTNTLVQGACLVWKSRPAPEKLSRPPCPPKDQAHRHRCPLPPRSPFCSPLSLVTLRSLCACPVPAH